ncbi:hypothetical protein GLOIN_2v1787684 [Rhizophagus irregularis DAOM 181602=DAOM 197198]|nr:hypothetical protein GLOIN_2v1787684 [Rhizophagus irregularis DAOM 181602=DAOM 197198]
MDIVTTGNLQKCKKCQKNLPLEAFINENTQQIKTCNICRHKATLQYKQSNQSNTEILIAMFQKFIRPRLDLVIYILLTRLIPHHQQQYNKYLCGWEKLSW